ncbi:MAG: hypothetical protein HY234_10395 [Acidobacteria bacterium]|nr:hypothetical protein [Acidobacteriota bacterium]
MSRRRSGIAVVLFLGALAGCAGPQPAPSASEGGTLGSSGITRVETLAIDRLARGSAQPNIIKLRRPLVDEQRNRVYFTGTLTPWLGVINTTTDQIVDAIDLGLHGYLSKQLALNPSTGILYFTTIEDQRLYRLDPVTRQRSAPVDVKGGGALSVDGVNDRVYAAAQGEIRVYDGNLALQRTLGGVQVLSLEVAPATSRLYVTTRGQFPEVKVFDTATLAELASYSMPGGLVPRFITTAGGRIYVSCDPQAVVIVDEASGQMRSTSLPANVGATAVLGGVLYVMTGYPYRAGYLPGADGAYGFVEVLDATTGARRATVQGGLQADGFDLHGAAGKLYIGNTGDSYIDVFELSTLTRSKRIDTATSLEDIVVRPSDGALVVRNRLGGGNSLLLVKNGVVSEAPAPGNWPSATLLDPSSGLVYSLSHYESSVAAFDAQTLAPQPAIPLGVPRLRTDALSTAALDASAHRLYAALPELGQLVAVDLVTRTAGAPVAVPGFDTATADGPGLMQLAVNSRLGRVYLFAPRMKKLFVYDSALALLRATDLSTALGSATGSVTLGQVFSDDGAGRLYVGALALDAEGTNVVARLPEGDKVVAADAAGNRLYAVSFVSPSAPAANDGHERLVELDPSSFAVLRRFDLLPIDTVKSAFGFDFARGLAYAGYFETGTLDVLRLR